MRVNHRCVHRNGAAERFRLLPDDVLPACDYVVSGSWCRSPGELASLRLVGPSPAQSHVRRCRRPPGGVFLKTTEKMKAAIFILLGSLFLRPCLVCANDNLFLPGDAFFPTVLTKAKLEELAASDAATRTFEYSNFRGGGFFCGYAGYNRAQFVHVDDEFIANLADVYKQIRSRQPRELREESVDGKTVLHETNGMRVLFYRSDFPYPGAELGLRYNENWVDEVVRSGHERQRVHLNCLVRDPEAVALSWRDASRYPGLAIRTPDVMLKPTPRTETPVVVTDGVKAIVVSTYDLDDFFQPTRQFLRLYIVDANKTEELHYDGEKWGPPSRGPF